MVGGPPIFMSQPPPMQMQPMPMQQQPMQQRPMQAMPQGGMQVPQPWPPRSVQPAQLPPQQPQFKPLPETVQQPPVRPRVALGKIDDVPEELAKPLVAA